MIGITYQIPAGLSFFSIFNEYVKKKESLLL
jgi:hypothetical protein